MEHKDNVLLRVTFKAFPELGKLNVVESAGSALCSCNYCALDEHTAACGNEGISFSTDCGARGYHYTKAE